MPDFYYPLSIDSRPCDTGTQFYSNELNSYVANDLSSSVKFFLAILFSDLSSYPQSYCITDRGMVITEFYCVDHCALFATIVIADLSAL